MLILAIYPTGILRLWYGYPTVRVYGWLVFGRDVIRRVPYLVGMRFLFGGDGNVFGRGWGCIWWWMGCTFFQRKKHFNKKNTHLFAHVDFFCIFAR